MVDTIRQLSTLQTLLANNTNKEITAQRLRDLAVSVYGARWIDDLVADTVLTDDHNVVTVDASGANRIITLPTAVNRQHRLFTIKKRDSANTWVRIIPSSGQTIDGHSQEYLFYPGAEMSLISDNANWQVLTPNRNIEKLMFVGLSSPIFTTSSGEESLTPTGLGVLTIPPNFFRVGRVVRIRARGYVNVAGTPTLAFRVKLAGANIASTGNMTMSAATTNYWEFELLIRARTIGATGEVMVGGHFRWGGTAVTFPISNTSYVTLDTTVDNPITVTGQFSVSSSSNYMALSELEIKHAA